MVKRAATKNTVTSPVIKFHPFALEILSDNDSDIKKLTATTNAYNNINCRNACFGQ